MVNGYQYHCNHSLQQCELKNKNKKKQITLFIHFLCDIVLIAVMHNTFTQMDISTQDLLSWLV